MKRSRQAKVNYFEQDFNESSLTSFLGSESFEDEVGNKKVKFRFLKKLRTMLHNSEISSIIRWGDDGTYFIISNCEQFVDKVMLNFFTKKCFSSFVRHLKMYSFKKVQPEMSAFCYMHPCFIREKPELMSQIKKKRKKSSITIPKAKENIIKSEIIESIKELERRIKKEGLKSDLMIKKTAEFKREFKLHLGYISELELAVAQLISIVLTKELEKKSFEKPNFSQNKNQQPTNNSSQSNLNIIHDIVNLSNADKSNSLKNQANPLKKLISATSAFKKFNPN